MLRLLAASGDFLGSAVAALVALPFANWGYRAALGDPPGGLYGGLVLGFAVYALVFFVVARRVVGLPPAPAGAVAALVGVVATLVLPGEPPGGWEGRLVFGLVVALGVMLMLGPRLQRPRQWVAAIEAVVAALLIVLVTPVLVALWTKPTPVPRDQTVRTRLDLAVVDASMPLPSDAAELPPRPDSPLWDRRFWVYRGDARGKLRLVAAKAPDPMGTHDLELVYGQPKLRAQVTNRWGRPGAARAIVLNVDRMPAIAYKPKALPAEAGTPGEVTRWRRLIAPIAAKRVPVFALLRSSDHARLVRWRAWTVATGGDAVDVREKGQRLLETAWRIFTLSAHLDVDTALAERFRPMLYFDRREQFAVPQDIDQLFRQGQVAVCTHELGGDSCPRSTDSLALGGNVSSLRIDVERPSRLPPGGPPRLPTGPGGPTTPPPQAPSPPGAATKPPSETQTPLASGPTTVYYFHVTHSESGRDVYVDYWWYLPYNDTPLSPHGLCAAGFEIPGITCFDHQSDWEGITVVLSRQSCVRSVCPLEPVRVQYAQHAHVVAYDWKYLVRKWAASRRGLHPLVFSALGSHASYPFRCPAGCWQVATHFPDGPHDGGKRWPNNSDGAPNGCSGVCLKPLPVRNGGRAPALWNAFKGHWGVQHCVLRGAACDVGTAPQSPSMQDRYKHPAAYDKLVTHD